jgi:acetyltransferase-like isoleucine patch superfamily enzyme
LDLGLIDASIEAGEDLQTEDANRYEFTVNENVFRGLINRALQLLARHVPGARTLRVRLHRWRGVNIGSNVWIGYDAIIESSYPKLVTIGDRAVIGIGAIIIGHFHELSGVIIEEDAFIGPGAIVLPNVKIGRAAVVAAGSVVTQSVPPMTFVQGNPAKPVANIGFPLTEEISLKEFSKHLKPIHGPVSNE